MHARPTVSFTHRKAAPHRAAPVAPHKAAPPSARSASESVSQKQSAPCTCGGGCPRCAGTSAVAASDSDTAHLPKSVTQTLRSSGEPLDAAVRTTMEMRFGRKFGDVRIHTGALAAESARDIDALAYTVGHQIVFRRDHYQPGSAKGRHLLAHELAHVVQQSGASRRPSRPLTISRPNAVAELQAEQATRMSSSSPPRLDRQELSVARSAVASQNTYEEPKEVPDDACDWKDPDDAVVAGIIETALGGSRSDPYTASKLKLAWLNLRNQREKADGSNCCDADLAAAEHYMYARFVVTNRDYDPAFFKAAIWFYGYVLKHIFPRTGICPQSPNTDSQREWAYQGTNDALIDLAHENAEKEKARKLNENPLGGRVEGLPGQRTWRPPGNSGGRVPID